MLFHRRHNHPFSGLHHVMNDFDRITRQMDRMLGRRERCAGVYPLVNVREEGDVYTIRAELPGITAEDLNLEATEKNVTISGEKKADAEENGSYHRKERGAGKFSRVLAMPGEINPDGIEASMTNGVLVLNVPKAEAVKPRQITIN